VLRVAKVESESIKQGRKLGIEQRRNVKKVNAMSGLMPDVMNVSMLKRRIKVIEEGGMWKL